MCIFRARLNHLWSIWYTVLVVLLQVYLLYLGLERYRLYTEMKWPHGASPRLLLKVYIILYSLCIPGLLFLVAFGVFKSGNIAGDNDRIGAIADRVIDIPRRSRRRSSSEGCCSLLHCMKSKWQHAPPLPQLIHLSMALMQLFAQQIMLSQLYRYGFINSGEFLNTELDFAYHKARQLAVNLPMVDNRLQGFRISTNDLAATPIGPNLLPILMHAKLFGVPLEFVNLLIALFAYACAYSSVFWRVSKSFSLIFSFHLLMYFATIIWSYLGFTILHRIQETNYASVRPVGLGQYLISSRPLKIYHPNAIIITYVATVVLISIAPIALYMYGYNKFYVSIMVVQQKSAARSQANGLNGAGGDYTEYRTRGYQKLPQIKLCCDGYAPHIFAIMLLILIVIAKAPTIYALMIIYQHEEKALLLSCIVVDIVYLFAWIMLWLILTLKRDWNFAALHQVHEIIALQNGPQTMTTSSAQILDKKPSELKNALILMHGDEMFLTDDAIIKQSILRHTQKGGVGTPGEGIYWIRSNNTQSPTSRKVPISESVKGTPEMSRLLGEAVVHRRNSENNDTSIITYNTMNRACKPMMMHSPPQQRIVVNIPKYTPDASVSSDFAANKALGTLQRNLKAIYMPTLERQIPQKSTRTPLQKTGNGTKMGTTSGEHQLAMASQPETYASIYKRSIDGQIDYQSSLQKRNCDNQNGFNTIASTYGNTYANYIRPQTRAVQNQQMMHSQMDQVAKPGRNTNGYYSRSKDTLIQQRQTDGMCSSSASTVRVSPVAENCSTMRTNTSSKDRTPYQRASNLKLSSFNSAATNNEMIRKPPSGASQPPDNGPSVQHATTGSWSQQRPQPGHQQVPRNDPSWLNACTYNKASSSATSLSQQQEQCFTPSSTLTSQGSTSNSSSHKLANIYSTIGADSDVCESSECSSSHTLKAMNQQQQQKPARASGLGAATATSRHQIQDASGLGLRDDSANYSLTSSNESAEGTRVPDYATSVV